MNPSAICLYLIWPTLTILLGACSAYSPPKNDGGTVVISGDVLENVGPSKEQKIKLRLWRIDGETLRAPPFSYRSLDELVRHPHRVESGLHRFDFWLVRNIVDSNNSAASIRSIEAILLANSHYRLTGEVIVGNAIKYWIEDVAQGEIVSQVFYDPKGLEEELRAIDTASLSDSSGDAHLEVSAKGMFADRQRLEPGRDCFSLVKDTIENDLEMMLWPLAMLGGGMIDPKWAYRSYEDICFEVTARHDYELKDYTETIRERGVTKYIVGYELWDVTDDTPLLRINRRDLKVKVDEFH